jgi:peroxiredoxin (alkyl hydroperoxide reductase subunit C)
MVKTEFKQIRIPLIGDDALSFTAVTTRGEIHFSKDYRKESR